MSDFGREDAIALYNVDRWGGGYFTVNKRGNVTVMPNGSSDQKIDLTEIIREAKARNLSFPLTVRFHDLLRDRVETINRAFADAIAESGYQNVYRGVFPIKVNQLREVVEEILDAGKPWHFGIEAGSKPELIAAMAMHSDPESLIICNGYMDTSFIRNALVARKLGKIVILVVEKLEELKHILKVAADMNVEPMMIGLRVRLLSKGAGKWATSGGENAKIRPVDCRSRPRQRYAGRERSFPGAQARPFPRRFPGAGHRHDQARPSKKPPAFTPSSPRWATRSSTSTSAAAGRRL